MLIIIAISLTLVFFGLLGLEKDRTGTIWSLRKRQWIVLPLLVVLVSTADAVVIVPANNVGVKYSSLSGVNQNVLREGMHFKTPFIDRIYLISSEVQTVEKTDITGQTMDAQWVNIHLDLKYRVNPENAFTVFQQFRTIENVDAKLIGPLAQRVIESVTTQYDIIDLLGEKRNEVYVKIEENLKTALSERGIDFYNLTLIDTDAGSQIEEAIQAEAVAKKGVETAKQALEKAKIEADQVKVKAQAEADVKLIDANAEAEANKMVAESLTDPILRKMEMEARLKWGWVQVQTQSAIIDATDR